MITPSFEIIQEPGNIIISSDDSTTFFIELDGRSEVNQDVFEITW
jgi:archaellum component FlaG (FlaF/FlaG flagellin family)